MAFSDIRPIFTIGHSHHSLEEFIGLLKNVGIEVLVDIRARPWNPFIDSFSKDKMKMDLLKRGIVYFFMGNRLGLVPLDPALLNKDNSVNYLKYEQSKDFKEGIQWLLDRAREGQVCLMTGLANPYACHRHWLVGQNLLIKGVSVIHIMDDGTKEVATADLLHYKEIAEQHCSIIKNSVPVN